MSSSVTDLNPINSPTPVDLAGLSVGLTRLQNESSVDFLKRIYLAAASNRDTGYQGTLNEIAIQFGLKLWRSLRIDADDPETTISVSTVELRMENTLGFHSFPLFQIAEDGYMEWRMLSDLVLDINKVDGFRGVLLDYDAPALVLAMQSNTKYAVSEQVISAESQLAHSGVVVGSEVFTFGPGVYTLTTSGQLRLETPPSVPISISYLYRQLPFELAASEAHLLGFTDSDLINTIQQSGLGLAYQIREAVSEVHRRDSSYWGR